METLEVAAPYRQAIARLGLISCADFSRTFLSQDVTGETKVFVKSGALPLDTDSPTDVFYKQYEYGKPSWRFLWRASKAWREYESYAVFRQIGIACAEPIAVGEMRDWLGRLKSAFIVTRAIPQAQTLIEFFQQVCSDRHAPQRKELRAALVQQLAVMARLIHHEGFFHNDLFGRNILVTWQSSAEPSVSWIDCPRGHFRRFLARAGRIKDLASLDKSAAKFCTRGERVTFMKHYLGTKKLDAEAKRLIRDTLAYRKRRWPDDWN
jgi:tRNA A-37 threonylcarbamoyl transferase component Bud32